MVRSFRNTFSLLIILTATIPAAAISFQSIKSAYRQATDNARREINLLAEGAAARVDRTLDHARVQALALGTDSDVRRGVKSVLFLERSDARLASFLRENPVSSAIWLIDANGLMVTVAPETLHETPPPAEILNEIPALVKQANGSNSVFFEYKFISTTENRTLYFATPVAGLLNKQGGAIIGAIPLDALSKLALSGLTSAHTLTLEFNQQDRSPVSASTVTKASIFGRELFSKAGTVQGSATIHPSQTKESSPLLGRIIIEEPIDQRFAAINSEFTRTAGIFLGALLLLGLGSYLFGRILLRPLANLTKQARLIGRGDYDTVVPSRSFREFDAVAETLRGMSQQIKRNIDAEKMHLEAELSALRSQMSPHFLFNTLNGIGTTIDIDPKRAAAMLDKLSDLYRKILESTRSMTSPIAHELDIVRLYLELETMRFGKRLQWEIKDFTEGDKSGSEAPKIPGLILQTLVENAIKHGVGKAREGGYIHVYLQKSLSNDANMTGRQPFEIRVCNTGAPLRTTKPKAKSAGGDIGEDGAGVGLVNSTKRLELIYGESCGFKIATNESGETEVSFGFGRPLALTE